MTIHHYTETATPDATKRYIAEAFVFDTSQYRT